MYPRNFDYANFNNMMTRPFEGNHMYFNSGSGLGCLWFIGWLFTIGFLKLSFGKGLLALIIWPYYLGVYYSKKD